MTKEERLLHWKTGRTEFTREELLEARRLISRDGDIDEGARRLPTRFIPVGGMVSVEGHIYRCVEASGPDRLSPCAGCDLAELNCTSRMPACSPFDRRDHRRVWFIRAL